MHTPHPVLIRSGVTLVNAGYSNRFGGFSQCWHSLSRIEELDALLIDGKIPAPLEQQPKETALAYAAFLTYVKMGLKRSIRAVAEQNGHDASAELSAGATNTSGASGLLSLSGCASSSSGGD